MLSFLGRIDNVTGAIERRRFDKQKKKKVKRHQASPEVDLASSDKNKRNKMEAKLNSFS